MSVITLGRRTFAPIPWRTIGLLAVLALLIVAAVAVYVGSQPRLPGALRCRPERRHRLRAGTGTSSASIPSPARARRSERPRARRRRHRSSPATGRGWPLSARTLASAACGSPTPTARNQRELVDRLGSRTSRRSRGRPMGARSRSPPVLTAPARSPSSRPTVGKRRELDVGMSAEGPRGAPWTVGRSCSVARRRTATGSSPSDRTERACVRSRPGADLEVDVANGIKYDVKGKIAGPSLRVRARRRPGSRACREKWFRSRVSRRRRDRPRRGCALLVLAATVALDQMTHEGPAGMTPGRLATPRAACT